MPGQEVQADQFELLISALEKSGYTHYEISNFAREGHMAKHNTNYWRRIPFVGIGPSAHSFSGNGRRWNIRNNALYIKRLEEGDAFHDGEMIDERTAANEMIMTGLRTMWGIDPKEMPMRFDREQLNVIRAYKAQGALRKVEERLVLTPQGRLLADRIASDLFFI